MTQEITQETSLEDYLKNALNVTGVFKVTAKHIEGTQMCEIQLPCRYKGKNLTIVVYEDVIKE